MTEDLPPGFQVEEGIAWGSRAEGMLEIKFHMPKKLNTITGLGQRKLGNLVDAAQNDPNVKVIFVHGGTNYTAGNDLSAFITNADKSKEEIHDIMTYNTQFIMTKMLTTLKNSVKPIVALVRGHCVGIGYTLTAHFDFVYCAPNAKFSAPFMASAQSPEGGSTYLFPQIFGTRKANEILLLDQKINAQEAVQYGFANGIIEGLDNSEWPDLNKIPTLGKLLGTDYKTLVNAKSLLN